MKQGNGVIRISKQIELNERAKMKRNEEMKKKLSDLQKWSREDTMIRWEHTAKKRESREMAEYPSFTVVRRRSSERECERVNERIVQMKRANCENLILSLIGILNYYEGKTVNLYV